MTSALRSDPEVPIRQWSRDAYDALVATGQLDGVPVELIEGEIVTMAPQGDPHARSVDSIAWGLDRALLKAHGEAYRVRQEKPFIASDNSEPEPDIAVVEVATYARESSHPSWAHLIVEVAESSRRFDLRHKPRVYATAGVPLYWVVDLSGRTVVVHTHPQTSPDPGYGTIETKPLTADLAVLGVTIRLSDLVP